MIVDWSLVGSLTYVAFIVVTWTWTNNYDVARATRPDAGFPWIHAVIGAMNAFVLPFHVWERDWLWAIADAVVVAMCARVVWHWWRRRRQGKPSRVLGLVRDLGHRLTVVNVPAKEGA